MRRATFFTTTSTTASSTTTKSSFSSFISMMMNQQQRFQQSATKLPTSAFASVPAGPPDPILGLSQDFQKDTDPLKVNLGVGVYRGDDGKPFVLKCVREAERRILAQNLDNEYAPITGVPGFVAVAEKLAFGEENKAAKEKRLVSSQVLSGTGSLRTAFEFLDRWYTPSKTVVIPNPTWPNHLNIVRDAHFSVSRYPYFAAATNSFDHEGMLKELKAQQPGTVVLLHACAHNPTGIDPTQAQWDQIIDVVKSRQLFPLVDMAYQGFASGDPERDAYALRNLSQECESLIVCQSFAKSFGLYGHRTGNMTIQCASKDEADRVMSQLKILIRPMYSNPPIYGARIVETIMRDPELAAIWRDELKQMAGRMQGMRATLVNELKALGSTKDWSYLTSQIGMMAYTGLSKAQVDRLKKDFHIYMTADGRAAITGLNSRNVKHVAKAFHAVTSS